MWRCTIFYATVTLKHTILTIFHIFGHFHPFLGYFREKNLSKSIKLFLILSLKKGLMSLNKNKSKKVYVGVNIRKFYQVLLLFWVNFGISSFLQKSCFFLFFYIKKLKFHFCCDRWLNKYISKDFEKQKQIWNDQYFHKVTFSTPTPIFSKSCLNPLAF